MFDDLSATDTPAGLRAHELVLLHGQPGSPADWQRVAGRLPAQLHAMATDRPGYGSSQLPAGGFAANARAVLDDLDSRGITRAVLVGHSYGGGVALAAASLAPGRVEAVVLLASVGPGCLTGWDKLLAAPGAGQLCALVAWRLTPWMARVGLAGIARRRGRPLRPDEHVNWQVWGHAGHGHRPLWRTFLTEQRALLRELGELERAIASVRAPVLVLADPKDTVVPFETARRLTRVLPDVRLQLVQGVGHHLPRRAAADVTDAIVAFLAAARITDVPDHSASRDVNSSRVLPVLAERGRARRAQCHAAGRRDDTGGKYPSRPCGRQVSQAAAGPAAQDARPRANRSRTGRPQARRSTPAAPGGDRGGHRRAGSRGDTGRGQADLYPCSSGRQRIAGVRCRRPAGHQRSGRHARRGEPRPGDHPAADGQDVRSAADRRRQASHRLRQRGILPVLRGRTLVADRRAIPFRRLEPPRHHDIISHRRVPGHRHALVPGGSVPEHGTHAADDRADGQRRPPAAGPDPAGHQAHRHLRRAPYVNSADQSGAVPFLDIANRYILAGAQYNPQVLAGLSAAQIASQLSHPSSPVAQAIDGSARVIVAAIDQILHDKTARS